MSRYKELYNNELQKIIDQRNQETTEPMNEYEFLIYEIMAQNKVKHILKQEEQEAF